MSIYDLFSLCFFRFAILYIILGWKMIFPLTGQGGASVCVVVRMQYIRDFRIGMMLWDVSCYPLLLFG